MRILVIEDDRYIAELIKEGLKNEGYAVDIAFDGKEGEELAESLPFDLITLDISMPEKNGYEICQALRQKKINTPILMLSCKSGLDERVMGLDCGADDFLAKPFSFTELYAKVRALLRRKFESTPAQLQVGNLVLDTIKRQVRIGTKEIILTQKEYICLEYFMRHPGETLRRVMIEQHVWNLEVEANSNVVDMTIKRLRAKLEPEIKHTLIETVRGVGYRLLEY